jgi:hypothetical protein
VFRANVQASSVVGKERLQKRVADVIPVVVARE